MNKDQRLLEEAYCKIYESLEKEFVFLPEEEQYVELTAKYLFELMETLMEERPNKITNQEPLYDFAWDELRDQINNPSKRAISKITLNGISKSEFEAFYRFVVERELEKYTRTRIVLKNVLFAFEDPFDPSFPHGSAAESVSVKDPAILDTIKKYLKLYLKKALTDSMMVHDIMLIDTWKRVYEWRKRRLKEDMINKTLSPDFDVSALEDF